MHDLRECYRILDLQPGASLDEVKQAYREHVKVWHPDRFRSDPKLQAKAQEKMKQINLAYERLCHEAATEASRKAAESQWTGPAPEPSSARGSAAQAEPPSNPQAGPADGEQANAPMDYEKYARLARWLAWTVGGLVAFVLIWGVSQRPGGRASNYSQTPRVTQPNWPQQKDDQHVTADAQKKLGIVPKLKLPIGETAPSAIEKPAEYDPTTKTPPTITFAPISVTTNTGSPKPLKVAVGEMSVRNDDAQLRRRSAAFNKDEMLARQSAAMKYPDLKNVGSGFHTKFMEEYNSALKDPAGPLADSDWPLKLADKTAKQLAGTWNVSSKNDPFDDSRTVILLLEAKESVTVHNTSRKPYIVVRFQGTKQETFIGFMEPKSQNIGGIAIPVFALPVFSAGQEARVKTRCDKMPSTSNTWSPSTDGTAIFAPEPASLAIQLLTGSRLLVEVIPKYGGAINMEFEVSGFKWALMPHSGLQALVENTARAEASSRPAVR